MKVPFSSNTQNHNLTTATSNEPKFVRKSPTLIAGKPISGATIGDDDHPLIKQESDGWDSLMRDLGLHDDYAPVSKPIPPLPVNPNFSDQFHTFDSNQFLPSDFGLLSDTSAAPITGGFIDELIRLAECFDANSLQLGEVISARLNEYLSSPTGEPLQRAAFYFKEAFQCLLNGSTRAVTDGGRKVIQIIEAEKNFSSISPIPMFSSFTANQSVLEAIEGSAIAHMVDFDIGLGGQWSSFMKELAGKSTAPLLRISAVVFEEYAPESDLIRDNLTQFARDLNIRFEINFIAIKTFEYLSFQSIKFMEGERVAVILSPSIFRRVGTGFLSELRRLTPRVVVHVDTEGEINSRTTSYRQAVIEGLEFYTTLLESIEAGNFNGGDWIREIETFVMLPKIVEVVKGAPRRGMSWKEALVAAGLRQVGVSQFAECQADCLLRRARLRGFHVIKRQGEMLLCWHDKPLVATSSWKY